MPRKLCEKCKCKKIVYRAYLNGADLTNESPRKLAGPKMHVCQDCASKLLKDGLIFNLRRIISIELGTKPPAETSEYFFEN